MADVKTKIKAIIPRLAELIRLVNKELGIDDHDPVPHPPATEKAISDYEEYLETKLPTSYRAFLELHNGYDWLAWPGHLVALQDVMPKGKWSKDVKRWKTDCAENGDGEVLDGIVIGTVDEATNWKVYLDPNKPTAKDELTIFVWRPSGSTNYPNMVAYFEHYVEYLTSKLPASAKDKKKK
jgi:hypothetical protein